MPHFESTLPDFENTLPDFENTLPDFENTLPEDAAWSLAVGLHWVQRQGGASREVTLPSETTLQTKKPSLLKQL